MKQVTVDGVTYLPYNNSLYKVGEEVTEISELDEGILYLHNDNVGKFQLKTQSISYSSYDAIFRSNKNTEHKLYYSTNPETSSGDEFTSATELEYIVPDQVHECPQCGSAAGDKDTYDEPHCFHCGFNTED